MLQDLKGQTNGKYYVQQFIAPELEKKKKKTTSGGSEKQSWKCKRAAALVMTRYES